LRREVELEPVFQHGLQGRGFEIEGWLRAVHGQGKSTTSRAHWKLGKARYMLASCRALPPGLRHPVYWPD
jgi:hypothetical protein